MCTTSGVIDDFSEKYPLAAIGNEWTLSSDRVMGGVSVAAAAAGEHEGKTCVVLSGDVSTANNGGFVQVAVDLSSAEDPMATVDASGWDGLELDVRCPRGEDYNVHLRTPQCTRVFSSFRATFPTTEGGEWGTVRVPFDVFRGNGPGCEGEALDVSQLRRLGLLGIGRDFTAELSVAGVRLYKN